jgi:hypothetical protein
LPGRGADWGPASIGNLRHRDDGYDSGSLAADWVMGRAAKGGGGIFVSDWAD